LAQIVLSLSCRGGASCTGIGQFHHLDHNNFLILGSQISLSMRSFCSLSGIPEVDFTASIMINSDECLQAVAIINREWYISCPKHVRVSTLCLRLIKPVLKKSEYLVWYCLLLTPSNFIILSEVVTFSAIALNISTEIRSESTSRTCRVDTELPTCRFFMFTFNLI